MKLPFSYRQQFFIPVLTVSLAVHAVGLVAAGRMISLTPEYGVEKAPQSMEVVLTRVEAKPERQVVREKVMTSANSKKEVVVEKIEEQKEKKEQESAVVPPEQGVREEHPVPHMKNPAPVYPRYARERGWEGTVILDVLVGKDGVVSGLTLETGSGYKILDEAAIKAVSKWRFKPASIAQVAFESRIRIPVRFELVNE